MKYLLSTLIFILPLLLQGKTLDDAFRNGKVSGDLRAFWYNGDRDLKVDRTALTVGGILSYQTAPFYGLQANASFFSSNGTTSLTQMPESGQTSNLKSDGSSINVLGEAALSYTYDDTIVKYGRQRLNTPLTNDYYNRMLPNSFEALTLENRSIADVILKGAYITKWKYKDSDLFISPTENYGFHRDIVMLGGVIKKGGSTNEVYDYYVPDVMNALYIQSETPKILPESSPFNISGAVQFLKENGVGDELIKLSSTYLIGTKLGLHYNSWSLTGLFTQIGDQSLAGTGGRYAKMGWGGFITYTDLQIDGETENAGAVAYGAVVTHRFDKTLEASLKYLRIDQSDTKQSAPNSLTDNPRPDSNEYNFDTTYQPTKEIRLRCRFAYIDYNPDSTNLYKNRAYDEFNTRIIADYMF
ncbi:MAG: OprD family outer membrane porin [Campylobacterales bacterium]|nr:OprD family outer membrane porin [Campylobacterales bacterium]